MVIVMALTSSMYYYYQETTLPIMYDHISENLKQSSYSANYMMESVNNLLSQMFLDSKITTLMYASGNYDPMLLSTGQKSLSSYKHSSPFVHSIYVYNSNLDSFFTSLPNLGRQDSETFFDTSILELMKTYDTNRRLVPIPRQVKSNTIPFSEDRFIDCYTFVYFETLEQGRIKDAIIVNINQSYVKELLSSYETDLQSTRLVTDMNGEVVLDTELYELHTDLSNNRFMEVILETSNTRGYFVTDMKDGRSLVTFEKLNVPDWY